MSSQGLAENGGLRIASANTQSIGSRVTTLVTIISRHEDLHFGLEADDLP